MRIYLMTDLEGVAGVQNAEEWTRPAAPYYALARQLLTAEVNAAVDGLYAGGATSVRVADGHGPGGVNVEELDPRVEYQRGWAERWPLGLEEGGFDAIGFVGQHARARTPFANMAHTQSYRYLELSINGTAIGELGQFVLCAGQLGVRAIFAAGDQALTVEAGALVPGIEAVAVKRGLRPGRGDECTTEEYQRRNGSAVHLPPQRARAAIREAAERAVRRALVDEFGIVRLSPPYRRVTVIRPGEAGAGGFDIAEHPTDIAALMNLPLELQSLAREGQLGELLVD